MGDVHFEDSQQRLPEVKNLAKVIWPMSIRTICLIPS